MEKAIAMELLYLLLIIKLFSISSIEGSNDFIPFLYHIGQ